MYNFLHHNLVWWKRHTTKILLTMKLTTFLLIVGIMQVSAGALAQRVTLTFRGQSMEKVLESISTQSGYDIIFTRKTLADTKKITIQVSNIEFKEALRQVFAGQPLVYSIEDNTVIITRAPAAKPGRISGKVIDDKGEPLPGANIKVLETGAGIQTAADGSYVLQVAPGTYTIEVTYISYQTQRITGILAAEDKNTPLNISLKPANAALQEVTVMATYRKASIDGLLTRQKNASEITNGISAEQIGRTPDRNIGESLKRISGVNTVDNKFVLVRGIGERYNSAMLDGVILPSTEAQTRNFSFDLIPANLVDNVVVSKTVTPDMNASFGGGLIQINTKDIPAENFMSFTAGTSYNDQGTGKDFFSHERGKYDYFGFDDGRRKFPTDLQHTDRGVAPNTTLSDAEFQQKLISKVKNLRPIISPFINTRQLLRKTTSLPLAV